MNRFKRNEFRYLIATDVAARGIDIDDVTLVINFDISRGAPNYVHRIGRSGRAGKSGKAITFFTSREKYSFQDILDYTKTEIQLASSNDLGITESMEQEFKQRITTAPERKEDKSKELNQSITKLCIRAGKKDRNLVYKELHAKTIKGKKRKVYFAK